MAPDKKEGFTKGVKNDPEKKGGKKSQLLKGQGTKAIKLDFRGCQNDYVVFSSFINQPVQHI